MGPIAAFKSNLQSSCHILLNFVDKVSSIVPALFMNLKSNDQERAVFALKFPETNGIGIRLKPVLSYVSSPNCRGEQQGTHFT